MAETSSREVASSSQLLGGLGESTGATSGNARNGASSARQPQEMRTSGFQAVNARAVSENAARSTPPTASSAQPSGIPAVAPNGPQTTQASSNARSASSQIGTIDDSMTDMATYGTRSRNRAGNARPNYAEDQEMDFEMSSAAATKKRASNGLAPAPQGVEEAKRTEDFTRFIAVNEFAGKESTPGAPGPAASSSKKRKAAGGLPQQAQTPPTSTTPAPTVLRKSGMSASSTMARETNVMTFTKHKSCLNKKGELVADDGTKLAVNGKPPPFCTGFREIAAPTPLHTTIDT